MHSSDRQARFHWFPLGEAVVVFSLILLYIWLLRVYLPSSWIAIFTLIVVSHICRKETTSELGFRWSNLRSGLSEIAPLLLFLAFLLLGLGILFGTIRNIDWHNALPSLALYCLWGLFQQYLLNGYFVRRFLEFSSKPSSRLVPILAAVFFAGAHLPNWFLMSVTFIGGYYCAKLYIKYRNLYLLGLAHGIVGFLLYLVAPDSISRHLYVGPKWFSL